MICTQKWNSNYHKTILIRRWLACPATQKQIHKMKPELQTSKPLKENRQRFPLNATNFQEIITSNHNVSHHLRSHLVGPPPPPQDKNSESCAIFVTWAEMLSSLQKFGVACQCKNGGHVAGGSLKIFGVQLDVANLARGVVFETQWRRSAILHAKLRNLLRQIKEFCFCFAKKGRATWRCTFARKHVFTDQF